MWVRDRWHLKVKQINIQIVNQASFRPMLGIIMKIKYITLKIAACWYNQKRNNLKFIDKLIKWYIHNLLRTPITTDQLDNNRPILVKTRLIDPQRSIRSLYLSLKHSKLYISQIKTYLISNPLFYKREIPYLLTYHQKWEVWTTSK